VDYSLEGFRERFEACLDPFYYSSGSESRLAKALIAVFALAFLINAFLLYYLWVKHRNRKFVLDISQPLHLFAFALRSPFTPELFSEQLLQSDEPEGRPLSAKFRINTSGKLSTPKDSISKSNSLRDSWTLHSPFNFGSK
jgi:preprotein translocase subunit SecG